jgi:hypothetical protein
MDMMDPLDKGTVGPNGQSPLSPSGEAIYAEVSLAGSF